MPCYRCGVRQVDPDRGASPWKRGVRGDRQVLVCPECQASYDWATDLDRCRNCGTISLVRRLGEVECKDCGQVWETAGSGGASSGSAGSPGEDSAPGLAEEVARALDRVLGRHP
jgi:hypothetical protein